MESFPEAIDAVALKAPGRLAMVVTTDGSSLTYERLATCSVFVARGLLALGVSTKQPLLSHMRRGCEWYILYVALSRLGVPLAAMPGQGHDQSHELRDLRWTQLLALKPQLLVVDGDALPVEVDLPRHRFNDVLDMGVPLNQELPDVCADDVLCYCFTGGTTGRQRCVPVTQRMALHELRHYEVALHWTGDAGNEDCARVLQASSLYWASAVFGQLDLALALQGCAVVSEDIDVKDLAHTVREQRVNILGLPPSMLGLMDPLDFIDTRSQGGYCHVRRLISWGEPCPEAVAYTWGASRWPWRFLDILISTEYWLSFVASERDAEGRSRFTPVNDLEVYLHPLGRTAEDEDFSELCLRGPGVCERLHSADGLDVTEAFLEHQGQRFYRSGDLAKWSGQDIVFRGRGDQLVKVFGKWVDLSDLSRRLANLPGVLEAATITGGPDEHHAVAVLDKPSNPDSFAAAYRILPSGGGVQLHWFSEPLPRKPETQKVDRARLLSQLRGGMASAPVAPSPRKGDTRQQDALLATVVEVLGNTSCSLQSSFLACGGDSVTALRCAAAARQRGLEISALELLSARTLAEAAKAEESEPLQKRPRLAPESGSSTRTQPFALTAEELQEEISFQLGLPSRAVDCSWPCTAFQELLLNALEVSETDAVRESPGTLQSCALLRPTVSLRGLRNAWLLVQQRCTALRSRFIRVRGRHFQVALRTNWSKEDLRVSQSSSGSLKRQLRALMKEDLTKPFHTTGPLCRLHLLRAKAENSDKLALLLSIHNSVSDGWSTNLLLQDLLSLAVGIAAPLQRPGQALDNIDLEVDRPCWWRRTLEGFRPTALQRQVHLHSFDRRRLAVRWEALRERAKAWQLTPAALVLAAWSLVWSRATGRKDFLLGAVLSGREAVPSDLLGCTASLVPLRLRVTDSWQTLQSFSTEVQRCLIAHASMWPCPSLTEIRGWCGLPPGPMFDCAWIFDHTPPLPEELCKKTGFELVCEHEVPAAGQEADTPELRVSRHDQEITVTLRGVLPQGQEGEAQLLLEELDSTLALLTQDAQDSEKYTVAEILLAVPLLPSLGPTLSSPSPKLGEDLAAFWKKRLLHYEATELPRSSQGIAAASWRAMPLMLPSGSKEIVIAATARLLGHMSGQEEASVLVPLGNREGTEDPVGWFPIQVSCKTMPTSAQVADELEEMASHSLVPRYAVERLLGIFPPLRPSTAVIEMKGPMSKSPESVQRWGDRCCHLWQNYSSHRDLQSVELVVVLARSHGCGLLIFTGVRGFDMPLAKIVASRLSTNVASMALRSAGKTCAAFDLGVAASPPLLRANLLELLLQSAKRTPRSTAIAEMDDMLSYSELFSCAVVTASELLRKRKDLSSTAAVLSERSAAAVVGLIAALLAGAAYCPLIPSQPLDRLVSMISIASITEMLFQESAQQVADHLQQHKGLSSVCIRLDAPSRLKLSLRDVQTSHATSGDAAMHVLFTSGSTGKPKVVRASHTAVMTHLLHIVRHHRLQATDVALQHTSLAWVAAAPEVWTPLLASAQLAVAPLAAKGGERDLETLAAFANRCTLQQYVPSVLQAMLLADLHPVSSTCHQLVLTGEPLPMELCHRVQSSSLTTLRNHYGQTEAADTTTVYLVEPGLGAASVPLGRPATQRQVWLEHWHGMCDIAELGELLVGGPGLHLDKDMEGSQLGAGAVLHTGDLARWVPFAGSMQLVCLGRKDRQVKVRGHRLELLEIEAVMKQEAESLLSRQVEALVTLCPITRRLVAYVRPPLSAQETETLLKACQGKLLAHAVPSKVIGVEEWPRTSTGKVDRKALPQPQTASVSQPPTSSTKMPIDASQYLQRSPVAPHRIREKGWQVLRGLLFGLVTSRASAWRMLLLPLVWNGWQQLLVPRHKGSLFAQDLAGRLPSLSTSVMLALLPWNVLVVAAVLSAWRLGGDRCCGTWMMWWLGLSSLQRQVIQDLEWYSWYLHPTRSLELAAKAFTGCKDLFHRIRTGYLPAKRPCDWDWDAPAQRPHQRPRLDYVWVEHEPTGMKENSSSVHSISEDLSFAELSLLEYLREEAGVCLEAKMPLATAFDSLRLTALVGGLRKSMAPQLTLRDALACDTVADLLKVISSLSRLAAEKPHDAEATRSAEPHFFKVREWPYMFSLSVCWALESEQVDVARVQSALQSLLTKHGALCVKLADPPAIWDLAMEAAANLSLARALLKAEFGGMKAAQTGQQRSRHRRISSIMESLMDFIGWLLWTAWPRLQHERTPEVNLDVVECEVSEQLELRSTWLLDGRNGRQFLENPIHAVLLTDAETGKCRLHIAVSHGLSDGFSGLPLLQDFIQFYNGLATTSNGNQSGPAQSGRFSGLLLQEARLKGALMVAANEVADTADIASWALPSSSSEGFDHFIWLQEASVKTLQSIVEQRMWCCSLDVAVLAALGSALARLHSGPLRPLRLRFVASARDQGDEGSVVADFADSRDLDLVFNHDVSVEDAARCIAECVRHRRWKAPDPRTCGDDRVYINVRPLLEVKSQPKEGQRSWHHITQWPPVEGERNWDRRNVNHALWIMADQVSSMEWVFCLKIRKDRSDDQSLGRVLEHIIRDLALQPEALLLPNPSPAVATKKRSSELPGEIRKQCKKWCHLTTLECHHTHSVQYTLETF